MTGKLSVSASFSISSVICGDMSLTAGLGDLIQSRRHVSCRHAMKVAGFALVEMTGEEELLLVIDVMAVEAGIDTANIADEQWV
jgi:hypothetical protein